MPSSKTHEQEPHDHRASFHRGTRLNTQYHYLSCETKQRKQSSHISSTGGTAGSAASGYLGSTRRDDPDLQKFGQKAEADRTTKKSQYVSGIDLSEYNMKADDSMPMERFLKSESRMDKFMQQKN